LGTKLTEDGRALCVTDVKPGGAIDSWNRQCVGGPSAGKAVNPGDKVVAVNGVTEPQAMLQELHERRMLGLAVVRGDPDCDIPSQWTAHFAARDARPNFHDATKQLQAKPWALGAWQAPAPERAPPRSPALRADAFEFVPSSRTNAPPPTPPAPAPEPPASAVAAATLLTDFV